MFFTSTFDSMLVRPERLTPRNPSVKAGTTRRVSSKLPLFLYGSTIIWEFPKIGDPKYSTLDSRILTIRTPKTVPLIAGKCHIPPR